MTVNIHALKRLIPEFDVSGPRYTSYPTANLFEAQPLAGEFQTTWDSINPEQPISVYVHVPFCDTVCFYCACNKIHTANRTHAEHYVQALKQEILTTRERVGRRSVAQLHFGGGTPTYLTCQQLTEIIETLATAFDLSTAAERDFSIEIDPRSVDEQRIAKLAELGFNRMSIGVQDFDPEVQNAINRVQADEQVANTVTWARKYGFGSINFDLIYGLPKQTVQGFHNTLEKSIALDPDRISLYAYAHLPTRFKTQRQIDADTLPNAQLKVSLFLKATQAFQDAGYKHLGMDHFVLPTDSLYQAQQNGNLTRNFMGYSTGGNLPLLGFGPSAIGQAENLYWQNYKGLAEYLDAMHQDDCAIERGYVLSEEDVMRRWVIQSLMCNLMVDTKAFEETFSTPFYRQFAFVMPSLQSFQIDNLLMLEHSRFRISELGRFFVRNICMLFDQHLNVEHEFSKTV